MTPALISALRFRDCASHHFALSRRALASDVRSAYFFAGGVLNSRDVLLVAVATALRPCVRDSGLALIREDPACPILSLFLAGPAAFAASHSPILFRTFEMSDFGEDFGEDLSGDLSPLIDLAGVLVIILVLG